MTNRPIAHLQTEQNVPDCEWSSDRWISCWNTPQTKVEGLHLCGWTLHVKEPARSLGCAHFCLKAWKRIEMDQVQLKEHSNKSGAERKKNTANGVMHTGHTHTRACACTETSAGGVELQTFYCKNKLGLRARLWVSVYGWCVRACVHMRVCMCVCTCLCVCVLESERER